MELGLFLSYQSNNGDDLVGLYDRSLRYAVAADRAGFDYVWTPEHHLVQFMAAPSALLTAVQIGEHVKCKVGTAVIVLPYHQPLQLAGEIAAADQILHGRLQLGVARGAYRYEFDKFGLDASRSLLHFIEMLDGIRELWRDPEHAATFSGEIVNYESAYVWPRPVSRPHPPIWLASQAPAAVEDAAARGYNVLNSLFFWDDQRAREVAEAFGRGRERAIDGSSLKLGVTRYAFAVDDPAAVESVLTTVRDGWRIHAQLHDYAQTTDERGIVLPGGPVKDEPSLEQLRDMLLIGTREELTEKVMAYRDMGVSVLNLNSTFGVSEELTLRSIEIFGEIIQAVSAGRAVAARQ